MKVLENKTVFLTGGLSGFGEERAFTAAKEGDNVVITDLKTERANKIIKEVKRKNSESIFVECDVSIYKQVESAIQQVISTFSSVDIALSNSVISSKNNKVDDMSEEDLLIVISANLNNVFNSTKNEVAQMSKQNNGVIVNMSSILGKVGFANSAHYVATKYGIIDLTQSFTREYATQGIRINSIFPGFVNCPLLANNGINEFTDFRKYIISMHLRNHLEKPENIVSGFVYLASDDNSFVTGTTFEMDDDYLMQ